MTKTNDRAGNRLVCWATQMAFYFLHSAIGSLGPSKAEAPVRGLALLREIAYIRADTLDLIQPSDNLINYATNVALLHRELRRF